jgi:hypothetical protein
MTTPSVDGGVIAGVKAAGPQSPPPGLRGADWARWFVSTLHLPADVVAARFSVNTKDAHTYFRATPGAFQADVDGRFKEQAKLLPNAPKISIVGDSHLFNFGTFRHTDEKNPADNKAAFGPNDFDQAKKGSPETDLERLATSTVITARQLGLPKDQQDALVETLADAWRKEVKHAAKDGVSDGGFITKKEASDAVADEISDADGHVDGKKEMKKFVGDDGKLIVNDKTRLTPMKDAAEYKAVETALAQYGAKLPDDSHAKKPLEVIDIKRRNDSGGSSFGLDRYYALVKNADKNGNPIMLEIKKCPSVDGVKPVDGKGIVAAAKALGGDENPLMGSSKLGGEDVLIREVEPEKGGPSLTDLVVWKDGGDHDDETPKPGQIDQKKTMDRLTGLVTDAATSLARAHTHDGDNAKKLNDWASQDWDTATKRLTDFAGAYADQNQKDFDDYVSKPPPGVKAAPARREVASAGWGANARGGIKSGGSWTPA